MIEKRINWLLILQGWAMLWVVIGHSTIGVPGEGPGWENALYHLAYSFHMPLFMLVSGWLFYMTRLKSTVATGGQISVNGERLKVKESPWTYGAIIKDKVFRLLLPGLVFSILAFILKLSFPGEVSRQTGLSVREIAHSYIYPYDNPLRELWFIVTLFWFFVLTPFWQWVIKKANTKWLCLVVLVILYFLNYEIEILCIGRVLSFAIWFYLGLLMSKEGWTETVFSKYPWWLLLTGLLVYLAGRYTNAFITTLGGITFSFAFALIVDKYIPKLFRSFRNYTYQIFLIGIFFQILVKIFYRHIELPYFVTYILCIITGLYVPVIVSKILEWINWKPLLLCVGLKQRNKDKLYIKS